MEKIMLAIGKFKEGDGHFEKFMGFMQSEEGMAERRKVAHVEKQFQEYYRIRVVSCLRFMFMTSKL